MRLISAVSVAILSLYGPSVFVGPGRPTAVEEPSGYILRMGGKGSVVVVRNSKVIDVTGQRRFLLLPGDQLQVKGEAWVEYYLSSSRKVYRDPAPRTSAQVPGRGPEQRRASRGVVAARRLGSPPEPANRLFAEKERRAYHVPTDGRFRLSAVSVSKDVRPVNVWLVRGTGDERACVDVKFNVDSKEQFHRLTWTLDKAVHSDLGQFDVRVRFCDGSEDTAMFEALSQRPGGAGMSLNQLRRAATAYGSLKPESDEWFLALNDLALAYEDLGCHSQAANLILDWWFFEPDNPAAREALLGLALVLDLGVIDKLFGHPVPEPVLSDRSVVNHAAGG